MEECPVISVIIPVYNVENWLERCVNSVCSQTYSNLEILLVDDGSTDQSGWMCDQLAEKDVRIKVIHKENGGLSDARNVGAAQSSGEYISFIDSDDWVETDFYRNLYDALVCHDADVCGCQYRKCVEGKQYPESPADYSALVYHKLEAMDKLIRDEIKQVVWNKLYKRSIIYDIGFEKGRYHEDEFWSYQVFGRIKTYVEIDYVGYNYFQRADSIMGAGYSLKRLDAIEAKVRRQGYLDRNLKELSSLGRVSLILACFFHGQQALIYLDDQEQKTALGYLEKVVRQIPITSKDIRTETLPHRVWIRLGKITLKGTCRIRNLLGVGV